MCMNSSVIYLSRSITKVEEVEFVSEDKDELYTY
jgi:hypothetical protein